MLEDNKMYDCKWFKCRADISGGLIYCNTLVKGVDRSCSPADGRTGFCMKPTILCFSHLCNAGYITGAEKHLLLLLRELAQSYNCMLVVPSEGILAHEAHLLGISHYVQPCQLFAPLVEPCPHLKAHFEHIRPQTEWESIVRLLRQVKPDYVLTNTSVHPLPAVAAKSLGIPTLWQLTECMARTDYYVDAVDFIETYADAVIASSNTVMEPFVEQKNMQPFPCRYVLYPSWNMETLRPQLWETYRLQMRQNLGIAPQQQLVGYIASSLLPSKGLEHFIHMALVLAPLYPQTRFLIVGEPVNSSYMEHCVSHIHQSPYASQFSIISFAVRIEEVYPAMDVVVVPSLAPEGFGLTALEGLVFGKAVVVYGLGGLSEIMAETNNLEYAVEPGNPDALVRTVGRLLEAPELLQQIQAHNRLEVVHAFGIERFRQQLKHLFVRFVIEHTDLFQAVRSSKRDVYIRHQGVFRRVLSARVLKRLGIRSNDIRLVTKEVLEELPKGMRMKTKELMRISRGKRKRWRNSRNSRYRRLGRSRKRGAAYRLRLRYRLSHNRNRNRGLALRTRRLVNRRSVSL